MTKTKKYNLNQWEPADPIRRTDFNADNAAIDAALAGNARALSDYKTANDAAVAKKADKTALIALEQSMDDDLAAQSQQLGGEIAALAAALGSGGGNCRVFSGSYIGTGSTTTSTKISIETPLYPVLVLVQSADMSKAVRFLRGEDSMRGQQDFSLTNSMLTVSWSDNAVSWRVTNNATGDTLSIRAGNVEDTAYYYAAFGYTPAQE